MRIGEPFFRLSIYILLLLFSRAAWADPPDDPDLEVVSQQPLLVNVTGGFRTLPGIKFVIEQVVIEVDEGGKPRPQHVAAAKKRIWQLAKLYNYESSQIITVDGVEVERPPQVASIAPLNTAATDALRILPSTTADDFGVRLDENVDSLSQAMARELFPSTKASLFGGRIPLMKQPNGFGISDRNLYLTIITTVSTGVVAGAAQVTYALSQGLPAYAGIACGVWVAAFEGAVQLRVQEYTALVQKYGQSVRLATAIAFVSGVQTVGVLGGLLQFQNTAYLLGDALLGGLIYIGATERFYAYLKALNKNAGGKVTPFQMKVNEFLNFSLTQAANLTELVRNMKLPAIATLPAWMPFIGHHEVSVAVMTAGTLAATGTALWLWEADAKTVSHNVLRYLKEGARSTCDTIANLNVFQHAKRTWNRIFRSS